MASKVLYPPIVNSYMPAFVAKEGAICRVYFSLSKFNSRSDFQSVHISVTKQGSGASVVKKQDAAPRYRITGIILNAKPVKVKDNLYYVDIMSEDIGKWEIGWIYKIQIRLSMVDYDEIVTQPTWLNANASNFSEWSTVCTTKAIGENNITIPTFNYDSANPIFNTNLVLNISTLDILGSYSNTDKSEMLYSYQMKLLKGEEVLEDSGILYPNQYINANQFSYSFKKELEENEYTFILEYETNNKYIGQCEIKFNSQNFNSLEVPFNLLTAETDAETTVYEEEEEGRIGLQLQIPAQESYFGNICIRRANELTNYSEWEDIKILNFNHEPLEEDYNYPVIYDYTAISGISYKYGIQYINEYDIRGSLKVIEEPIKREYQFSYLLGENEQQLKLKFDNTLSNYKKNISDAKVDTIGSKYPFITRNGNMDYRSFNLSGLISYNMDEANLFLQKDFMGREMEGLYDYTYEREFREEVLNFLYSDKPKLFKSPTEGNFLVRLMNINTTPNKSLNRMIYSFSADAYEITEPTLKNYIEYNFTSIGEATDDYRNLGQSAHIGQYNQFYRLGDDIIQLIYKQHNQKTPESIQKVVKITDLTITIDDDPLSIGGWELNINGNKVLMKSPNNVFKPGIDFTDEDTLFISQDEQAHSLNIIVDYTYIIEEKRVTSKIKKTLSYEKVIGQIVGQYITGTSLYSEILNKYLIDSNNYFRYVYSLGKIIIESNPGTYFTILYHNGESQEIRIGDTGLFAIDNAENIIDILCDDNYCFAMVNYLCQIAQGAYKEE